MTIVSHPELSRRLRKKVDIRARIISTAITLFSRHGFSGVTVDHIAEVADLGKGTLYNYFSTKEDIVVAYMVDCEREIQSAVAKLLSPEDSLESTLCNFIRAQLKMKEKHHAFVRVFLAQMFSNTQQFFPHMLEMQKFIDPPLETLFRYLHSRNLLRNDIDIPQLTLIFKTIQLGLTALWAVEGPPFQATEHVMKQEMKWFCQGLERKNL